MLMDEVLVAKMAPAIRRVGHRRPALALEPLVLEDGLDDEVVAGDGVHPDRGADPAERGIGVRRLEPALLDLAREVAADPLPALGGQVVGPIGEGRPACRQRR